MARSDEGAKSVEAIGGDVHHGSIEDLESLRTGAAAADAVIHLAFIHDFSKFQENCEKDRRAIETMGSVFAGSRRPLIVSAGAAGLAAPGGGCDRRSGCAAKSLSTLSAAPTVAKPYVRRKERGCPARWGRRCARKQTRKVLHHLRHFARDGFVDVERFSWSGRRDLNPGPLAPQASALARLRHGPNNQRLAAKSTG